MNSENNDSLHKLLIDAIRAVPAVKYAQGVLGIVSVVVVIGLFKLNLFFATLGILIILGLMFGLLLFAIAAKHQTSAFKRPALVLMWLFVITVSGMLGLAVSCVFFNMPMNYPSMVAQFSSTPTADCEAKIRDLTSKNEKLQEEATECYYKGVTQDYSLRSMRREFLFTANILQTAQKRSESLQKKIREAAFSQALSVQQNAVRDEILSYLSDVSEAKIVIDDVYRDDSGIHVRNKSVKISDEIERTTQMP